MSADKSAYNDQTRCRGKNLHPKCKVCARRRSGDDDNIFANPPTASAAVCKYFKLQEG